MPAPWVLPALVAFVQVKTNVDAVDVGVKVITVSEVVAFVPLASVVPTDVPPKDASIVALDPDNVPYLLAFIEMVTEEY